jgi:hypothetical protein
MSTLSSSAPPVEPRWFSIRLAQLVWILAATLLLGMVTAALRFGAPVYRQHLAVKEIEHWQGYITAKKRGPAWLRSCLGPDQMKNLDEIQSVTIAAAEFDDVGAEFDDAALAKLGALKDMTCLSLSGTQITDAGLVAIGDLKALTNLNLSRTQITDAGLKHLADLTNLRELLLDGTRISGSGLEHVNRLTKLEVLSLEETRMNDFGLVNLDWMTSLRHVWLTWSDVSEIGALDARRTLPHVQIHTAPRDTRAAADSRIRYGIISGPSPSYPDVLGEQIGLSDVRAVLDAIGMDEPGPGGPEQVP